MENARPSRDGGPTRQDVTLTANVLGGYDDNLTAGLGSGSGTSPNAMVSGPTASVDGTLGYFRGNGLRSVQLDTTGSLTGYPGNLDSPAPAGVVNLAIRTPVGRDLTLGLSQRVSYDSLFNVFSPGAGGTPLPPGVTQPTPTTGLFERNSWSSSSSVSLDRRWGRRDTTSLAYSYRTQQFLDDDYGDNTWHELAGGYRRVVSSQAKAGVDYRYRNGEYVDSSQFVRPTTEHRIEGVTEFAAAPSRRRSYTLSLGAGAGYLASVNVSGAAYQSWLPIGHARFRFNVSPSWYWEGGYQRETSLLQGVTDELYTTDTASLATGGSLTSRIVTADRRHLQQLGDAGGVGRERHDGRLRRDAGIPVHVHRQPGGDRELLLLLPSLLESGRIARGLPRGVRPPGRPDRPHGVRPAGRNDFPIATEPKVMDSHAA